jgi:hypothetical protein
MRTMIPLLFLLTDYEQIAELLRWSFDFGLALFGASCAVVLGQVIHQRMRRQLPVHRQGTQQAPS